MIERDLRLRDLRLTLGLVPLLMGVLAVGLIVFGAVALVTSALVALWGLVFGTVPQSLVLCHSPGHELLYTFEVSGPLTFAA